MIYLKKLAFAPLFLVAIYFALNLYKDFLGSYTVVFSFSWNDLVKLAIFTAFLILTSLFFVVFASLAQDFRLVGAVSLLGAAISFLVLPQPLSVVIIVALLICFLITFLMLENRLKTYLTFQATTLLTPSVKGLTLFLILALTFGYYLAINSKIQREGFEIPDPLMETLINFSSSLMGVNFQGEKYLAQIPQLPPERIKELKNNPDLLKQFNLTPADLDQLQQQTNKQSIKSNPKAASESGSIGPIERSKEGLKSQLKAFFQAMIKPYLWLVAPILALAFFSLITTIGWVLSLFVSLIIWLIFYILEKSGFITFTKEMREVKKMVV